MGAAGLRPAAGGTAGGPAARGSRVQPVRQWQRMVGWREGHSGVSGNRWWRGVAAVGIPLPLTVKGVGRPLAAEGAADRLPYIGEGGGGSKTLVLTTTHLHASWDAVSDPGRCALT